jgi:hypothetical protein
MHLGIAEQAVDRRQRGTPQGGTPGPTPVPVEAFFSNTGDASAFISTSSSGGGRFAISSVTIRSASRARIRLVSSEGVTCRVAADGSSATCDLLAPQVTVVFSAD